MTTGYAFASELKSIEGFDEFSNKVKQVTPGSMIEFDIKETYIKFKQEKQINEIQHFCNLQHSIINQKMIFRLNRLKGLFSFKIKIKF